MDVIGTLKYFGVRFLLNGVHKTLDEEFSAGKKKIKDAITEKCGGKPEEGKKKKSKSKSKAK